MDGILWLYRNKKRLRHKKEDETKLTNEFTISGKKCAARPDNPQFSNENLFPEKLLNQFHLARFKKNSMLHT